MILTKNREKLSDEMLNALLTIRFNHFFEKLNNCTFHFFVNFVILLMLDRDTLMDKVYFNPFVIK